MSLTRIGSIGINTGIAFAGVTTIVTLNTENDALSIGSTVNVGSGITLGASGDIFATGVSTFSGNLKVGSGVTISPDGDGFYTGIVTATTFSGSLAASNLTGALPAISGANLTNLDASDLASGTVPTARLGSGTASSSTFLRGDSTFAAVTSTTINNNANNRVITGSGTANTLEGESNLTFTGSILTVTNSSGASELTLVTPSANDSGLYFNDGSNAGALTYNHSDNSMRFRVDSTEKLRITSAGNLAIGNDGSFPIYTGTNDRNFILGTGSDDVAIHLHSGTDKFGGLYFGDATSGGDRYVGYVEYKHDDDYLRISTGGSERVRIDSDGRVGIKNTNMSSFNDGMDDLVIGNGTNGTSPGMTFYSNSSDIGSISFRDSADTGISGLIQYRHLESPPYMRFMVENTNVAKFTTSGLCFNNDTAAANALDDYEEGTFTATCSNGITLHSDQDLCMYTKIGRQVTVRGQIRVNDENGGSQNLIVNNLPFTNSSGIDGSSSTVGAVRIWDQNIPSNAIDVVCEISASSSDLNFWINRDDASGERMKGNQNAYALFTITYFAA